MSLLYTDTDSLVVSLNCEDLINSLSHIASTLDMSNLYPDHALHSKTNQSKLYHMKLEMAADRIIGFVGLGPKSYSLLITPDEQQRSCDSKKAEDAGLKYNPSYHIRTDGLGELKKAKGVASAAISELNFTLYLKTLLDEKCLYKSFMCLKSENHVIHKTQIRKKALSPLDTKRHIMNCNVHTVPYGHYKLDTDLTCSCDKTGAGNIMLD